MAKPKSIQIHRIVFCKNGHARRLYTVASKEPLGEAYLEKIRQMDDVQSVSMDTFMNFYHLHVIKRKKKEWSDIHYELIGSIIACHRWKKRNVSVVSE